jgi:hypothetical protein
MAALVVTPIVGFWSAEDEWGAVGRQVLVGTVADIPG